MNQSLLNIRNKNKKNPIINRLGKIYFLFKFHKIIANSRILKNMVQSLAVLHVLNKLHFPQALRMKRTRNLSFTVKTKTKSEKP